MTEARDFFNNIKEEINKHKFKINKNYILDNRRRSIKIGIEERLKNDFLNQNMIIHECLFNFWEFVNNEYQNTSPNNLQELNMTLKEFEKRSKKYNKSNIICLQEEDDILDMINKMEAFLNANMM